MRSSADHARPTEVASATVLLGRDHDHWGEFTIAPSVSGLAASAISVGAQPGAPSMASKGDAEQPNEDALVCLDHHPRVLLAVADAHFGLAASQALALQLASLTSLPDGFEALRALVADLSLPASVGSSASTLLVAIHDRESGAGCGISFGDCSLVRIGTGGVHHLNVRGIQFLGAESGVDPDLGHGFQFFTEPGELLVAFTDGVNECNYRSPSTSVGDRELARIFEETGPEAEAFTHALVELALQGVDGHPGGEDNIAVVASVARTGPAR